jgi:hypothetical protein
VITETGFTVYYLTKTVLLVFWNAKKKEEEEKVTIKNLNIKKKTEEKKVKSIYCEKLGVVIDHR